MTLNQEETEQHDCLGKTKEGKDRNEMQRRIQRENGREDNGRASPTI
jgi:hypothetical protein